MEATRARSKAVLLTGAAGLGLLSLAVMQVLWASGPTAEAPSVAVPLQRGRVAAEGRVTTYPGAEVLLSAERSGRLVRVLFEERQQVRRGDLLAQVDPDEVQAELEEVRARIREADAEIRLAEASLDRRRALVSEEVATEHDLDLAVRDLDVARARRATAQAELSRLEAQLRKTRIIAPLDGTITSRDVDAGEMVEPGDPVATLTNLGRLRIEGEADEADAAALEVGADVLITADGFPGESWRGTIEEVADTVTLRKLKPQDPGRPTDTRILSIKVAFAEPTPLRLGTTVELSIEASP